MNQQGKLFATGLMTALLCLSSVLLPNDLFAKNYAKSEYAIKAAFIYNFTKFIKWPKSVFHGKSTPFAVCVVGEDPFGDSINSLLKVKSQGRSFEIRRREKTEDLTGCHILFISSSETKSVRNILEAIRGSGALTIGDTPMFARSGVMINFYMSEGKIRLEINLEAITKEKIDISSKMLGLARIVE